MKTKPSGNPTRIKHCLIMIFYEHPYSILLYILVIKKRINLQEKAFVFNEFQHDISDVKKLLMCEMISLYFMGITSRFFENLLRYFIYSYKTIIRFRFALSL